LVVATRVDADHDDGSRDFTGAGGGRRGTPGTLVEYLRRDARGQPVDTQYRLVSRDDQYDTGGRRDDRGFGFDFFFGGNRGGFSPWGPSPSPPAFGQNAPRPQQQPQPYQRPLWRGDQN
jgi:hypothetical protein